MLEAATVPLMLLDAALLGRDDTPFNEPPTSVWLLDVRCPDGESIRLNPKDLRVGKSSSWLPFGAIVPSAEAYLAAASGPLPALPLLPDLSH